MSRFVLGIILGKFMSVDELGNSFCLCVVAYGATLAGNIPRQNQDDLHRNNHTEFDTKPWNN